MKCWDFGYKVAKHCRRMYALPLAFLLAQSVPPVSPAGHRPRDTTWHDRHPLALVRSHTTSGSGMLDGMINATAAILHDYIHSSTWQRLLYHMASTIQSKCTSSDEADANLTA